MLEVSVTDIDDDRKAKMTAAKVLLPENLQILLAFTDGFGMLTAHS